MYCCAIFWQKKLHVFRLELNYVTEQQTGRACVSEQSRQRPRTDCWDSSTSQPLLAAV